MNNILVMFIFCLTEIEFLFLKYMNIKTPLQRKKKQDNAKNESYFFLKIKVYFASH